MGIFHMHRYTWGDKYGETLTRLKDEYRWYVPLDPLTMKRVQDTREKYTRYFQDGVCKCGHIKKREITH